MRDEGLKLTLEEILDAQADGDRRMSEMGPIKIDDDNDETDEKPVTDDNDCPTCRRPYTDYIFKGS